MDKKTTRDERKAKRHFHHHHDLNELLGELPMNPKPAP